MKYVKGLILILLIVAIPVATFAQTAESYYGTTYGMYLQRQGTDGHAFILHNAKFNNTTSTYQWFGTHTSFGSRGLLFSYLTGITFFADNVQTTANTNFTPTPRFFIGNNGNVGVGTTAPAEKLQIEGSIRGNQSGALRISTGSGYIDVGPRNANYAHFITDRSAFYFEQPAQFAGPVTSYATSDLRLGTNGAQQMTIKNSTGNVGIGTITPGAKLDVASGDVWHLQLQNTNTGGTNWKIGSSASSWDGGGGKFMVTNSAALNASFVIDAQKKVGIGGVLNPETKLHVADGIMSLDGSSPTIYTGSGTGELNRYLMVSNSPGTPTSSGLKAGGLLVADAYNYANPSKSDLVVKGYVGIGTPLASNPNGYRLAVNGTIGAKEVRVEKTSATWPDYVFRNDYQLPALSEVEEFIGANNHLQDVPSAAEIEKNGHGLGEMDAILLKKIEELTLYAIEQQKRLEQQQAEIDALKEMIKRKK